MLGAGMTFLFSLCDMRPGASALSLPLWLNAGEVFFTRRKIAVAAFA